MLNTQLFMIPLNVQHILYSHIKIVLTFVNFNVTHFWKSKINKINIVGERGCRPLS